MMLLCCEDVIENEIKQGGRQKDIATTYAMAMQSEDRGRETDWKRINQAILLKWGPRGLERVKVLAHDIYDSRQGCRLKEASVHEYARRLDKALAGGIIDKGSAALAEVRHDDTGKKKCAIFSGGECNCDPDILIRTTKGVMRVHADGSVSKMSN